jgi:hypothetical protein
MGRTGMIIAKAGMDTSLKTVVIVNMIVDRRNRWFYKQAYQQDCQCQQPTHIHASSALTSNACTQKSFTFFILVI